MLIQRLTRPLRGRNNETTKHKKVRASWRNGEKEQRMKGGEIKEPDLKKKKKDEEEEECNGGEKKGRSILRAGGNGWWAKVAE